MSAARGCHGAAVAAGRSQEAVGRVVLVGSPNVGKSALFNALTGVYVTVSNYPGTTVEVSRGRFRGAAGGAETEVVDTPGMYSLRPITEEERVARRVLIDEHPEVVLHVVDAKNLERMLPVTLQLIEAGFPVMLAVNIIDEAERLGLQVDAAGLERELGVPVVATAATSGRGLADLRARLLDPSGLREGRPAAVEYGAELEAAAGEVARRLTGSYGVSRRSTALLALQRDPEILELLAEREGEGSDAVQGVVAAYRDRHGSPAGYTVALALRERARRIAARCLSASGERRRSLGERLSEATIRPLTGIPILLAVLYFGLYQFVGVFGAGTLVDFLEGRVFEGLVNPFLVRVFQTVVPWPVIQELLVGEYGVLTLGLRYSVGIILPIVATFFLAFSILEDSGYFPRLALLVDRIFKRIGLNGRAVIPMVLGLGCDTMATMVTRTLETRRERVIATLLLALAVPCSAQLGVILGILAARPAALLAWALVVIAVLLVVGLLSARLLPGKRPSFYMELPPLRLPRPANVLVKTYSRVQWYLLEVMPFFLLASVALWAGRITGLFQLLVRGLQPVMGWLGLPPKAAVVFIFGFFRRDYGAAGLYDLQQAGALSGVQLLVASVTLTLFIPCVAQFAVMLKERGWKTTLGIAAFIVPFAFGMGALISWLFALLGVSL